MIDVGFVTSAEPCLRWMALEAVADVGSVKRRHNVAIAIPARDEVMDIAACLVAIDASAANVGGSCVTTVVFVNNSRDATAAVARATPVCHTRVIVVEEQLDKSASHAGGARRRALDLAAATLPSNGVLMTTDADSRVDHNWIAANLNEIEGGADAVAGAITFAPGINVPVTEMRHAEWQLAQLQARLNSLIDPVPENRWPTHIWTWGAALALTASAYRAIGGLPEVPLAEDRALADLLHRYGFRVRRSHRPVVFTSHRLAGRAPGGFADLLSQYIGDDTVPCDAAIEPTGTLVRRLAWRAYLRKHHARQGPVICERMVRRLQIGPGLLARDGFGHWWSAVEQASLLLRRERVLPKMLPLEIARAKRLIKLFEYDLARQSGNPVSAHAQ